MTRSHRKLDPGYYQGTVAPDTVVIVSNRVYYLSHDTLRTQWCQSHEMHPLPVVVYDSLITFSQSMIHAGTAMIMSIMRTFIGQVPQDRRGPHSMLPVSYY